MTESALTVVTTTEVGTDVTASQSAVDTNGSTFANDGTVVLLVNTLSGAKTPTLTITGQNACAYGVTHNRAVGAIATGKLYLAGPFSTAHFNDASNLCHITWDQTDANTKVLAFRKGPTLG